MYEISGFTKTNSAFDFDKKIARIEFSKSLALLKNLSCYHAGFTDLSHLSDEGAHRGEELAEYLLSTDTPDPEILEEWEWLNSRSSQIKVNENAETVFESMWKPTETLNAEFGKRLLSITLKSSAVRGAELICDIRCPTKT